MSNSSNIYMRKYNTRQTLYDWERDNKIHKLMINNRRYLGSKQKLLP